MAIRTVEGCHIVDHRCQNSVEGLTVKLVNRGCARCLVRHSSADKGDDLRWRLLLLWLLWLLPLLWRRWRLGGGLREPALDDFEGKVWALIAVKKP